MMHDTYAVEIPDGDELFNDDVILAVEAEVDRYLKKPNGTSDQGYKED